MPQKKETQCSLQQATRWLQRPILTSDAAVLKQVEKACGVSGLILGVNPFNQPGVEAYKKNMFALLDKPGYEEESKAIRARL